MRLFLKARGKKEPIGTITTRKDGRRYKKVAPGQWEFVSAASRSRMDTEFYGEKAKQQLEDAYRLFTESTGKMSWAGIGIVEHLEDKYKVYDFDDLKALIKDNPWDLASKIFRSTKDYVDRLTISTSLKQAAVDRIGRSLIALRNAYSGPKERLMVKIEPGKYRYKQAPSAAFPASAVKAAKRKLAGWTDMKQLPTASQVRGLLASKLMKVVSGKPDARKKWQVRQLAEDVVIPFKADAKGIEVRMRQARKIKQRTKTTAEVSLTIPYPYARQFLNNQIKSTRTRNALVGQLERSVGYRKTAGIETRKPLPAEEIEPRSLPGPAERVG